MSGESYMESDFYKDSDYTADISTKMRVPDRLTAHGGVPATSRNGDPHIVEDAGGHMYGMQVPDRILLNGNDQHLPSKSVAREMQLEQSVLPPTPEHVRVQTPPRNIHLDEVNFPSARDQPYCVAPSPPTGSIKLEDVAYPSADEGIQTPDHNVKAKQRSITVAKSSSFEHDLSLRAGESTESLSVYEEVQMMRRQIAKLNHRVMAVELENQQAQQREMVLTVLCSAYFLVKAMVWLNKSF